MQLSDPQYKAFSNPADILITGGSAGGGKSFFLTRDPLRHCQGPTGVSEFRGILFRRVNAQLEEGLLEECNRAYEPLGAKLNQSKMRFTFPNGSRIKLSHMALESDYKKHYGPEYQYVGFDEINEFPEEAMWFLWTRCRSTFGVTPTLRGTCNPDNSSWLYRFLAWWIDPETGYPIKERIGAVRHVVRNVTEYEWYDEPQYRINVFGKLEKISASVSFVPFHLSDNQFMGEGYESKLRIQNPDTAQRLLDGCWLASSNTGTFWPRHLFKGVMAKWYDWPGNRDLAHGKLFAVDPSLGVEGGDPAAIVCAAVTQDLIYVDSSIKVRPNDDLVRTIFAFTERHNIGPLDLFGIEQVASQEYLARDIYRHAKEHPTFRLSRYLWSGRPIIDCTDRNNKSARIKALSQHIGERRIRFMEDSPDNSILLSQLMEFTGKCSNAKHDDGADALAMALSLPLYDGYTEPTPRTTAQGRR